MSRKRGVVFNILNPFIKPKKRPVVFDIAKTSTVSTLKNSISIQEPIRNQITTIKRSEVVNFDKRLTILADVHMYPPLHNAGAEWMLHRIFQFLIAYGHRASVLCSNGIGNFNFDGVNVHCRPDFETRERLYQKCDVVFTHLDCTMMAISNAKKNRKPIVHLIHNDWQLDYAREGGLFVFNSEHLANREFLNHKQSRAPRAITCIPPILKKDYECNRINSKFITLINLNENKGAGFFYQLAERNPQWSFLGIMGAYGIQLNPPSLPNLKIEPSTAQIRDVFARTKILLCPSDYESFGRVAAEASCSGIPTIATPTPGLRECLGLAGIFLPKNIRIWSDEIKKLLSDTDYYSERSKESLTRSEYLETISKSHLNLLNRHLQILVQQRPDIP